MLDLLGQQEIFGPRQNRDDFWRRLLRRIEVALRVPLLRDRPPEWRSELRRTTFEIDRCTLRVRRRRHSVIHELQQHLEIQHPRERFARLPQCALIVHVSPVDVAIEQASRDVAGQGDEDADNDNGYDKDYQFLGSEVVREPGPGER